ARGSHEKEVVTKAFQEARLALTDALSRFDIAAKRLKERLDTLLGEMTTTDKPDDSAKQQREKLALPWIEARSKVALSKYLLAQTFADSQDAERVKLLKQAGQAFDSIFQDYRGRQVGLLAHMWHGKTLEDSGDAPAALETYDEVLAAE